MIIAKVILIGRIFGLGRRFEDGPLILSVMYKSILFGVVVLLFGIVERLVEGLFHKDGFGSVVHGIAELGLYEIFARVLMLMIAFIPSFAFWEIGRVLGFRNLAALFFSRRARSFSLKGTQ